MRIRKVSGTAASSTEAARFKALRLLERRPHAEREIARKLALRGFEDGTVARVVDRLKEHGLLDDDRFAHDFVRWRLAGRAEGRRLLAGRLIARGVERGLADRVAAEMLPEPEERALAVEAARKFVKRHPADDLKGRRLLYAFLARRGFGADAIRRAVRLAGADGEDID
jgi:regulatory protein